MGLSARCRGAAIALLLALVPAAARSECSTSSMRITFYTCAEGLRPCLSHLGNQPIPFRSVAVGDRDLLGRWLYIEDLVGWVLASDTGGALGKNAIDVFIGEARMVRHARRLGVQHWNVTVCEAEGQETSNGLTAPAKASGGSAFRTSSRRTQPRRAVSTP